MTRLLFSVLTAIAAVSGLSTPAASADPYEPYCYDQRLCSGDFSDTYYCPDTGGFVGPFGACDALVTGPYAPGGLRPNQSIHEDE